MHSAALLSHMHCCKADKHPTESSSDTEHSNMTPSSSLKNSDSEDDNSEISSSEAAVPTKSLNLCHMSTNPKTSTLHTPSLHAIVCCASKQQVNASSYVTRLNKEVSISYTKRLNASLFDVNKDKASCAKAAALQLQQEKLCKMKKQS